MSVSYTSFVLQWAVGMLFISSVWILMLMRRMVRELPIFFTYLSVVAVQSVLELVAVRQPVTYFLVYWIGNAIAILLAFMVLDELFRKLFQPYEALRNLSTIVFRWAILVLLLIAGASAAAAPSHLSSTILAGVVTMERSVRVAQVGLVAFLFAFTSYFHINWKDVFFGIALGFGLNACGQIAMNAAFSHYGASMGRMYFFGPAQVYDCAVIVWAVYLLRQAQPAAQTLRVPPRSELVRWNEALLELRHQ